MPYVRAERREAIDAGEPPENVGELTYALTREVDRFLKRRGEVRFEDFALVVAALEQTKFELNRRPIAEYEDRKLADHGEVFTFLGDDDTE